MMLPILVEAQTFSRETILWTGMKESQLYELLKVKEENGKVKVIFAVADDRTFPYSSLEIISYGTAQKVQKFIKKILDLNDKMEDGMSYQEEKNKFLVKKSVIIDEERLYVSTDLETIHAFRPPMLKIALECLESYISNPKNPKIVKRFFN